MSNRRIVSVRQIEVLVDFLENHRDLAIGRLRSKEARALSFRLWSECADLLNAEADGVSKTAKEWQKWYTDYKSRILGRQRQININLTGTGGGTGVPVIPLCGTEERLCALLRGSTTIVGRSGTPPEQVRINPIFEIEEDSSSLAKEHAFAVQTNNQLLNEQLQLCDVASGSEIPVLTPRSRHPENLGSPSPSQQQINEPLHSNVASGNQAATQTQRSRRPRPETGRRPNRRTRQAREVPPNATNSTTNELEESRRLLINLEASRCETTRLLADGVQQMAAALAQAAEAIARLADAQARIAANSGRIRRHRRM